MAPGDDDLVISADPGRELLAQVPDLVEAAGTADGVPALNEAGVLALRHPHRGGTRHLVAALDGDALGYAQLADDGTGQVVVHPSHRRRGVGRRLVAALLDAAAGRGVGLRVWALGNTPAAAGLAARTGLEPARVLLVMSRPLADLPEPSVPAGVVLSTFSPGADEDAWLHVNARAFAHHPEQGGIDREDLAERMAEPWFDPAGFFLARRADAAGPGAAVLGFHWTKQHDALGEAGLGEVYVLGVDPDAQGRGLAKALLLTGLAHLRDAGDTTVELYVEADQAGPVGLYTAYGFTESSRDVMYAGPDHPAPATASARAGTTP